MLWQSGEMPVMDTSWLVASVWEVTSWGPAAAAVVNSRPVARTRAEIRDRMGRFTEYLTFQLCCRSAR